MRIAFAAFVIAQLLFSTGGAFADELCHVTGIQGPFGLQGPFNYKFALPKPGTSWDLKVAYGKCIDHVSVVVNGGFVNGAGGTGGGEHGIHLDADEYLTKMDGAWARDTGCDDENGNAMPALLWLNVSTNKKQNVQFGDSGQHSDGTFHVSVPDKVYIAELCGGERKAGPLDKRLVWAIGPIFKDLP